MKQQRIDGSPLPNKFPTEIFGIPYTKVDKKSIEERKKQYCPFLRDTCIKPRKSEPHIKVGICSVGYKGRNQARHEPVIICPHRFKVSSVFSRIQQELIPTVNKGESLIWVPEVSLGVSGSIDYVLAKQNSESNIVDFSCVEIQAAGTTGTPYPAVQEFMQYNKFLAKSYKFGINWANEFAKTMMQQVYKKGIVVESWKEHIIFVLQDLGMEYLKENYNTEGLGAYNTNKFIHFFTFSMQWDTTAKGWDLVLKEKYSTDNDGVRRMLSGALEDKHLTKGEFVNNIKERNKTNQS